MTSVERLVTAHRLRTAAVDFWGDYKILVLAIGSLMLSLDHQVEIWGRTRERTLCLRALVNLAEDPSSVCRIHVS